MLNADVTISVKITDERALWETARQNYIDENPHQDMEADELDDMFGDAENPDLSACLRQLLDPGVSPDGTEIEDSTADIYEL